MTQEKYLTTQEIAEQMRKKKRIVQKWCKTGKLPAFKMGRDWLVEPKDYQEFKNRHMIKAG